VRNPVQELRQSAAQADAVLGMALRRLTSLEAGKLREESASLAQAIQGLEALLGSQQMVLDAVKRESQEIADKFGDGRRTAVRGHLWCQLKTWLVFPYVRCSSALADQDAWGNARCQGGRAALHA
jgi:uncharacterized coiled-coil protein SlyX